MISEAIPTPKKNLLEGDENEIQSISFKSMERAIEGFDKNDKLLNDAIGKVNALIGDFNTEADRDVLVGSNLWADSRDQLETSEGAKTVNLEDYNKALEDRVIALNRCLKNHLTAQHRDLQQFVNDMGKLLDVPAFVGSLEESYLVGDGNIASEKPETRDFPDEGEMYAGGISMGASANNGINMRELNSFNPRVSPWMARAEGINSDL